MSLKLLLVLCYFSFANAHNWLTSPARGNEAGENNGFNGFQSPPCPQRTSRIHTQVGLGQKFPVEWAAGHGFGSYTYLVVLKAEDEPNMVDHSLAMLDEYLADADASALTYMSEYKSHHVSHEGPASHSLLDQDVTDIFHWIPSMDGTIGIRPSGFRDYGDYHVYTKTSSTTNKEVRAKYTNSKYPWIISVHRFPMEYDFPESADVALVEIPDDQEVGQYIVQYLWSGYYDCVDVNVIDTDSTDIWGSGGGTTGFDRIDHCKYLDYPGYATLDSNGLCHEIRPGDRIDVCADACENDGNCDGVQVVPYELNDIVLGAGVWSGTEYLPSGCTTTDTTEDLLLCFNVATGTSIIGPSYRVSRDPEDPVFYSSCFKKSSGWTFQQESDDAIETTIEPGFIFGEKCLSCSDMRANAGANAVPVWKFTDECVHCDPTQG